MEPENGQYKLSIEQRITRLETKVDDLMENHLPHLQKKIDQIHWLIVTTLTTGIVGIAMKFI